MAQSLQSGLHVALAFATTCNYCAQSTPHCQLWLQAQTFQTPALAAFDIEVDANSCFPELLLAVATVDVACCNGTLATGAGKGVYSYVVCWVRERMA